MTKIILLRHADTEKDKNLNASEWGLSEFGKKQAVQLLGDTVLQDVDVIYTSTERKSLLTAKPLANKLNLNINQDSNFDEVKRGDTFYSKEEFELEKQKQLSDFSYSAFDGESLEKAYLRFKEGVEAIGTQNEGKTILIVTHGTVLNAYLARTFGFENKIVDRWQRTPFAGYAILENGQLIKDIV